MLAMSITLSWAPSAAAGDEAAIEAVGRACRARSVVVMIVGPASREVSEFGHSVSGAISKYRCYTAVDVTDSLEAGMGKGLERVEEGRAEAEKGMKAFLAMRLSLARDHFSRSVDAYSDGFAYLPYGGPLADSLMYLGASEAGLGRHEEAVRSFRAALRIRPDADPSDYSALPEVADAFDEASVLAGADVTGALMVDSRPAGAEVYVDQSFVGVTPVDEPEVAAGPHWVELRKTGFIRKSIALDVPAGGSAAVTADQGTLKPARRKPLYDTAMRKLLASGDMEAMSAIEDVKALFLSDMALIVRVGRSGTGFSARLSLWDLATMQRIWSGTEPESGAGSYLGRGAAESLVSRAIAADEELAGVQEGGAATLMARKGVWWKQWWFWTLIGSVVVGGTVAAVLLTRPDGSDAGIEKDGNGAVIIRF